MNKVCKICGNSDNNKIIKVKERIINKGDEFDYLECSKCKCVVLNEGIEDWNKWYPPEYNPYHKHANRNRSAVDSMVQKVIFNIIIRLRNKRLFQNVLESVDMDILLKRMYGTRIKKTDRILDVGCANGDLLDSLYDMGWKKLTGVDLFVPEDIMKEKKWEFVKGDIFSLQGKYDCIILNHSFEHMENPGKVIKQIKSLLSKNGQCIISIPLSSGIVYEKYRENYCQLDAPRHVYIYTRKGMEILCNSEGLKINRVLYDSAPGIIQISEKYKNTNMSLDNIVRVLGKQKNNNKKYKEIVRKSNILERGDQAIFYISRNK